MHFIVDAYNLLFRTLKKKGSLEKSRQLMISELNTLASDLNLHITLVFDGAEEHLPYPTRGHFDSIELVYTPRGMSADEYIIDAVENAKSASKITVVSNDREVAGRSKNHRAKTLSIDEFLSFLSKKNLKRKQRTKKTTRSYPLSQGELARLLAIFEEKLLKGEEE